MGDRDPHELIEQLARELTGRSAGAGADQADHVVVLVVAALLAAGSDDLLADAMALATATGDRQLVTIAGAFVAGDHERVHALVLDHLVDHPPRPVLVWIADLARVPTPDHTRPTDLPSDRTRPRSQP